MSRREQHDLAVHNRRSHGGDAIDPTCMIEDLREVRQ